jgi:hydroxymethylglutaryl-CoA synthase
MNSSTSVGIDAFGFYIPKHFLPIEKLALKRNIPSEKLTLGLGLKSMAVCEKHETTDFMAAQSILDLCNEWEQKTGQKFDFNDVDKIYLGTESSIDSAKPSITYAIEHLKANLHYDLTHIDFLDMTFACIGGIDAMLICVDYVRLNPSKKCIVVVSDNAIYDLETGGEYTQGAGAIAVLITHKPSILEIDSSTVGVSTANDFDFYKPLRSFSKEQILREAAHRLGCSDDKISQALFDLNHEKVPYKEGSLEGVIPSFWNLPEDTIHVHRKQPVYDGKHSNDCYEERIAQALNQFSKKHSTPISQFSTWIFHLPYAFQGRRTASKNWWEHIAKHQPEIVQKINQEIDSVPESAEWWKSLAKCTEYKKFVQSTIARTETLSSQLGNLYTGSIFMAAVSALISDDFTSEKPILFLSYGSGSKSKVFAAQPQRSIIPETLKKQILSKLEERSEINFETYELWHRMQ